MLNRTDRNFGPTEFETNVRHLFHALNIGDIFEVGMIFGYEYKKQVIFKNNIEYINLEKDLVYIFNINSL